MKPDIKGGKNYLSFLTANCAQFPPYILSNAPTRLKICQMTGKNKLNHYVITRAATSKSGLKGCQSGSV